MQKEQSESASQVRTNNKEQSQLNASLKPLFSTQGLPPIISKKVAGIVQQLNSEQINIQSLKAFLSEGIPDQAAIIRQYCWKIILGYLPTQRHKWQQTIEKQENIYRGLVHMFLPPQKFFQYPILLKKNHPRFEELEEDYLLWEQIEKDTSRTHAQFSFFASESTPIMIPYFTSARKQKFKLIYGEDEEAYKQFVSDPEKQRRTYRYDYMSRILYIYSKLNPKIQYVQGMNQILAPIFYLVNITKVATQVEEAACFFMFNNAISDLIELHIKDLDKSHSGIYGKLHQVNQMLMVIEPDIWDRMDNLKIDPFFYCFRWVTLLYAQDFELFDTIRLWECIFSAKNKLQYINFLAIAIIKTCENTIMKSDFTSILQYLQDIRQNTNIYAVIAITNEYVQQYKNTIFDNAAIKTKKVIDKKRKKQEQKRIKQQQKIQKQLIKKQKDKKKQQLEKEQMEEKGEQEAIDLSLKLKKKTSGWLKKVGNAVNKIWN